jgi:hypothetical protein
MVGFNIKKPHSSLHPLPYCHWNRSLSLILLKGKRERAKKKERDRKMREEGREEKKEREGERKIVINWECMDGFIEYLISRRDARF